MAEAHRLLQVQVYQGLQEDNNKIEFQFKTTLLFIK